MSKGSGLLQVLKELPSMVTEIRGSVNGIKDVLENNFVLPYTPTTTCIQSGGVINLILSTQAFQTVTCGLSADVTSWTFGYTDLSVLKNGSVKIQFVNSSSSSIKIYPPSSTALSEQYCVSNFAPYITIAPYGVSSNVLLEMSNILGNTYYFSVASSFNPSFAGGFTTILPSTASTTAPVVYDPTTQNWAYSTSSKRYKENVIPLRAVSPHDVNRLNPIEYDSLIDGTHHIGLIAEEANDVNSYFSYTKDGEVEGINQYAILVGLLSSHKFLCDRVSYLESLSITQGLGDSSSESSVCMSKKRKQ